MGDGVTTGAALGEVFALYPALAQLPAPARARVAAEAVALELPAGSRVFAAGDVPAGFPLVLEGSVRVAKVAAQGRELALYRVGPGEGCILTSSCLLGAAPYTAQGIVERATRLLLLPPPLFAALLTHEPFRAFVFRLFSERLADLTELVEAVAFRRLDARLAERLLGRGAKLRITHQQLADELGTVREMVSRVLKSFEEQGLVSLGREQIEIVDPAGLRRIAGPAENP
jgi:CRP/FNR family transcriptional regulator